MLSGRHPHEVAVWTNRDSLSSSNPTFAHSLGAAGYETTIVGRLHSLGPDQERGYQSRLVGDHHANYWGQYQPSRGVLDGTADPSYISLERSGPGLSPYELHDEDVTAAAVAYLHQLGARKRAGIGNRPFLLSLGYMLPHAPFVAQAADYEKFRQLVTLPRIDDAYSPKLHPYFRWWRQVTGIERVEREVVLRARAAYWALVSKLDSFIGQVIDALQAAGLADETMVVYTSDHGDQIGEHGLWWKHTFYEESARVPAILSWPGVLPAGRRSPRIASALDLTATIVDAARAPALPASTGRSLLPAIAEGVGAWDDVAFSEYCSDEFAPPPGIAHRMVRSEDWKLIYYEGQPAQLFNISEDPEECCDRSDDPAVSGISRELTDLVLSGWNPAEIRKQMRINRECAELTREWARVTRPTERYRWAMTEEMNRLDGFSERNQ